jgi:hypothetical protein
MHDMMSGKERTVSAKNGVLDMLGSDYRKPLDGLSALTKYTS